MTSLLGWVFGLRLEEWMNELFPIPTWDIITNDPIFIGPPIFGKVMGPEQPIVNWEM